jgi:curved DNA-binding protein CbpA
MSKLFKLPENYTWSQLKDSYKKLAIQNHPDKGGDPDFFNYITEQFQKLALEIKTRDANKSHFDLKQNYKAENNSFSKRFGISQVDDTFNSKFNKTFDENKFIDDDIEFGYGSMMTASSKVREDININNVFGKSSVSSEKFNSTFETSVKPSTNIIKYKEPEALPSSSKIIHSEIGNKTTDYSGKTSNNSLAYTDFKVAYTEERIPTDSTRKMFKSVKEYQQYSDTKLKQGMTEKELLFKKKYEKLEDKREQERLSRIAERDKKLEDYYERVSRLGLGV